MHILHFSFPRKGVPFQLCFAQFLGMMAYMIVVIPLRLLLMRLFQSWVLATRLDSSHHVGVPNMPSCTGPVEYQGV